MSVYDEAIAVYSRDRVLGKFTDSVNTLPYSISDIKISHNDYLIDNVYNDAINKLYSNWLFLISNSEISSTTSPASSIGCYCLTDIVSTITLTGGILSSTYRTGFDSSLLSINTTASGTKTLSSVNEIFLTKNTDTTNNIVFSYGKENNFIYTTSSDFTSLTGILSGTNVEFNKQYSFTNVTSVAINNEFLFVLDRGSSTLYKFDASGILNSDHATFRTGIQDSEHPGLVLVKSLGGKGKKNSESKLYNPRSLYIYNNLIYVLDNGNFSIKIYDTNLNFIKKYVNKNLFKPITNNVPVSIVVDVESDISNTPKIFLLTSFGNIVKMNLDFSDLQTYKLFEENNSALDFIYKEHTNFKKLISSDYYTNILYVVTNKRIIKYFKTNFDNPVSFFDLNIDSENFETINSASVDSLSGIDRVILQTSLSSGETKVSILYDNIQVKKLYHDNFYTNYFTLSDIRVKPKEIVNAITFNKTTEKIIYNHSAFFENLNKKIYSYYNTSRQVVLSSVAESIFDIPNSFNITDNYYIGLNEPLVTDVINRPLEKIYNQQVDLFNILKEEEINSNPPANVPEILKTLINEEELQLIQVSQDSSTVKGGNSIAVKINRSSTKGEITFDIYNILGSNTYPTDINGYIPPTSAETLTFTDGTSSLTKFYTTRAYYDEIDKSFDTFITNPSSAAEIDQDYTKVTNYINKTDIKYQVYFSNDNITSINEGSVYSFYIIRENSDNTFTDSISVNVFTTNITAETEDYTAIISDGTYSGSLSSDFVSADVGLLHASNIYSTGTIVFSAGISGVKFDLSAVSGDGPESDETFTVTLSNPSTGSVLGTLSSLNITIEGN